MKFLQKNSEHNGIKDFSWYLFGTILPVIINLIKNPIFTRHFTAEEYGYFSLVFVTYSYIAIAIYSWLSSAIWRYYYEYQENKKLKLLFSNITGLHIFGSILLTVFSAIWYMSAELILVEKIILFSYLYILFNDIIGFYLIIIRLDKKAKEYNLLHSIRALTNFLIVCLFAFLLKSRIEALAIGFFISTLALLLYVIYNILKRYNFLIPEYNLINKITTKLIIHYGMASMITSIAALILTSSDRYFIAFYHTIKDVGVYNQNYAIAQLSIFSIITAFFNTINPELNKRLTNYTKQTANFISKNIFIYIILISPIAVYIAMYAYEFNLILLGNDFRSGYITIPYIVMSLYIYGLALFPETRMKFANNFKPIIMGFTLACLINIVLNIIILRYKSFEWAAITTLIAYSFLTIFLYTKSRSAFLLLIQKYKAPLIQIHLLFFIQFILHKYITCKILPINNLLTNIGEGVFFLIMYGVLVYIILRKENILSSKTHQ